MNKWDGVFMPMALNISTLLATCPNPTVHTGTLGTTFSIAYFCMKIPSRIHSFNLLLRRNINMKFNYCVLFAFDSYQAASGRELQNKHSINRTTTTTKCPVFLPISTPPLEHIDMENYFISFCVWFNLLLLSELQIAVSQLNNCLASKMFRFPTTATVFFFPKKLTYLSIQFRSNARIDFPI